MERKLSIARKLTAAALSLTLLGATAYAYDFPQPDWGALLSERISMETETEFEMYVEGRKESAPYYGARLEPRAGTYIGMVYEYSQDFQPLGSYLTYMETSTKHTDLYAPEMMSDNAVAMVGWTVDSLGNIDYDYIRASLDNLSKYNKPMFIRFANEMNCSSLGDDPDLYVQVFRNVANMVHEYPNFAVVWAPNDMGSLDRPFQYYYPGDEYVDWVGLSCYMTKYFLNDPNTDIKNSQYFMTGDYAWATNKIKPFMKFLSDYGINKPVMISEGGVARYNNLGTDYTGWHEPRLRNMLWYLNMKYPQIKMINYFNNPYQYDEVQFYISDYPESVSIYKEAAANGSYLRSADAEPEFVFSPANNGETLIAKDGIVNLYTLAYFANKPDITVNYKIDGVWYHSANQIPYKCGLIVNNITDGKHTLTISSEGTEKSYDMYKSGQCIAFGRQPDTSIAVPEKEITVTVNGDEISFDQPPVIEDGRTLVPVRAIFEALGAEVNWNENTQTVTSQRGDISIHLTIGNNSMDKNGEKILLDVPAKIIEGRTLVPARAVAEAFDCAVDWDGENRRVIIEQTD